MSTTRQTVQDWKRAALIQQLGSIEYAQRASAQAQLVAMGLSALPELRKAQQDQDPEIAARATSAIKEIIAGVETRRDQLRNAGRGSVSAGDLISARRQYLDLLALPEPQLRDARAAVRLFEREEDWPALATAYIAAAESMWRVTRLPPEQFIRPAPQRPTGRGNDGVVAEVQVQTELDGEWVNARGQAADWIDRIRRIQKELVLERIKVLRKLGELYVTRLKLPDQAVTAYASAGRQVPLCEEPLEKLIPQMWPKVKAAPKQLLALEEDVGGAQIRRDMLDSLADAQVAAGDLSGAAETRLRAMLAMLFTDKGDWNAYGAAAEAEVFWQIASRLPTTGKPLPTTLWLHVLDRDKPALEFPSPEDEPHGLPFSFPGPRLVMRPGQTAKTLSVSADMETPASAGGSGGVRCFTMIDGKVNDLGWVQWYDDKRKGHEWRTATFAVPPRAGIIRLEITPYNRSEFHVRALKVNAQF